jgi:SAM-dependent methyltransferase
MTFEVPAEAYGRFMGRFSEQLAVDFAATLGVVAGQRAIDVGCGPGALTAVLVELLGTDHVAAVDPSPPFVEAVQDRLPGVDVRRAPAEALPFEDASFDVAAAQLVVHFMQDPVAGLREMARVTRPGGVLGANVWDHAGGRGPLSPFWSAVRSLDPSNKGEDSLSGAREGHLAGLFEQAGLSDVRSELATVTSTFETFEEWWEPYTFGVGPAGEYVNGLDPEARERLRTRCAERFPEPPFDITASAWTVTARR